MNNSDYISSRTAVLTPERILYGTMGDAHEYHYDLCLSEPLSENQARILLSLIGEFRYASNPYLGPESYELNDPWRF